MKAIKNFGAAGVVMALAMASCNGNNTNTQSLSAQSAPEKDVVNIKGQWYIESIVFGDSAVIGPEATATGSRQYFEFNDSTYNVMTNCNAAHGTMTIQGDSVKFGEGAWTELACDDMSVEDALRKILPQITIVDVENDSIIRLNCSPTSDYILLRKSRTEIK